jgi:hypothetical protein
MALTCEGCGEKATRWSYTVDGPWADSVICYECRRRGERLKRLSWAVTFRVRLAKVLPPDDGMTVPVLRLLMAVDDVRRAQFDLVAAHERLGDVSQSETFLRLGDYLYAMRRLFSHLHEAGVAVRRLDTSAKKRVDALLAGRTKAVAAVKSVRTFFNAGDYERSFVSRVRNTVGFHYDDAEVAALVKAELKEDSLLEATVSEVGGSPAWPIPSCARSCSP